MHDISENIYLAQRINPIESYTLDRFLHNELAIEQKVELNDIRLAVYNILLSHGFRFQLSGCKYLASLAARYIVKSDYNQSSAISDIALSAGIDEDYIVGCIDGSISDNTEFIATARKTLCANIPSDRTSITDVVAMIGAIFKIYFNYITDTEHFEEDDIPAINFKEAVFKHGKR